MDKRIQSILSYIEKNLNIKLSLNDLAKKACMSTSHFHSLFKKETGRTPFEFIEEIKMTKAHTIILGGNSTVYELTNHLGYKDYETFSRAFKKHYAIAPDDLKAIAQRIKLEMEEEDSGMIIKIFKVESIDNLDRIVEEIGSKLKTMILEKGYSDEDIRKAKVMTILPKLLDSESHQPLIKNKFVISNNLSIWQTILKESGNGTE